MLQEIDKLNPKKYVVFVEDRRFVRTSCSTVSLQSLSLCLYSSNGTFVGGEKIGELAHTLHTHRAVPNFREKQDQSSEQRRRDFSRPQDKQRFVSDSFL